MTRRTGFKRTHPAELHKRIQQGGAPLLLDVRRRSAFENFPQGLPQAVAVLLDEQDPKIPPIARDRPIVTYCMCSGEGSSARVAYWLTQAGFSDVTVLVGGLPAWLDARLLLAPIAVSSETPGWKRLLTRPGGKSATGATRSGLIPLQADQTFLAGVPLPTKREMAVLFVDMVDSTTLLFRHQPEQVLALVQAFMEVVVEVAIQHCGDVRDFEGDGALLFFAGPGEVVPACFHLREQLNLRREQLPDLPLARFSVDCGDLVIGPVGGQFRRALAFVGPSVNIAARLLKLAPPNQIAITETMLEHVRWTEPDLAAQFKPLVEKQQLKGIESPVTVYLA